MIWRSTGSHSATSSLSFLSAVPVQYSQTEIISKIIDLVVLIGVWEKIMLFLCFHKVQHIALNTMKKVLCLGAPRVKEKRKISLIDFHLSKINWLCPNQNHTCCTFLHERKRWQVVSVQWQNWQCVGPCHPFFCEFFLVRILLFTKSHMKIWIFWGIAAIHHILYFWSLMPLKLRNWYIDLTVNFPWVDHLHEILSFKWVKLHELISYSKSCHSDKTTPPNLLLNIIALPWELITAAIVICGVEHW